MVAVKPVINNNDNNSDNIDDSGNADNSHY